MGPRFIGLLDKVLVASGCVDDHRDIFVGALLDLSQALKAVLFGHVQIKENKIGVQFLQLRGTGVDLIDISYRDFGVNGSHRFAEKEEIVLIIIDQENVFDGPLVDVHTMTFKVYQLGSARWLTKVFEIEMGLVCKLRNIQVLKIGIAGISHTLPFGKGRKKPLQDYKGVIAQVSLTNILIQKLSHEFIPRPVRQVGLAPAQRLRRAGSRQMKIPGPDNLELTNPHFEE